MVPATGRLAPEAPLAPEARLAREIEELPVTERIVDPTLGSAVLAEHASRRQHGGRLGSALVVQLVDDIVGGAYAPGATLPTEADLGAKFGVEPDRGAGVRQAAPGQGPDPHRPGQGHPGDRPPVLGPDR